MGGLSGGGSVLIRGKWGLDTEGSESLGDRGLLSGELDFGMLSGHEMEKIPIRGLYSYLTICFPCGSVGEESSCSVADLGSIPGLGRSPGEGIGYPLQSSWASLVAQLVKNLPAMRETLV